MCRPSEMVELFKFQTILQDLQIFAVIVLNRVLSDYPQQSILEILFK